ncbi:hypothetical protein FRC12_002100 [Ceratobasidium sp. 428]|nr:hypothetical protein FRC12_002100 [Ceratobasidium sp. 428]
MVEEIVEEPVVAEPPKSVPQSSKDAAVQPAPPTPSVSTLAPSAQPEFIRSSAFSSPARAKTIQAVLSTTAASWSRRMSSQSPVKSSTNNEDSGDTGVEMERAKTDEAKGRKNTGIAARSALRERLAGMALKGSQPVVELLDEEEENGEEEDELEEDEEVGLVTENGAPMDVDEPSNPTALTRDEDQEVEAALTKTKDKPNDEDSGRTKDKGKEKEKEEDPPRPAKKPRQRRPSPEPDKRPTEFVKGGRSRAVRCAVDIGRLKLVYQSRAARARSEKDSSTISDAAPASETNWENPDAAQAELSLSRVIQKKDFLTMDILGQFNLGFVIVRLKKQDDSGGVVDDLFIIDQHAADEKYNFERLQRTTKIQSQRLIRPRLLELSIVDELTALDNLDILKKNGFVVQVDKEAPEGERPKLRLAAQPSSKDTMFDMKDLEEILHQMQEGNPGDTVRCSKARAMFAMRACRSSIMIGTALKQRHMVNMVRNLAGMDLPWNCPHGRPTMRHLCNLRAYSGMERSSVDWVVFSKLDV